MRMPKRIWLVAGIGAVAALAGPGVAFAQTPEKPDGPKLPAETPAKDTKKDDAKKDDSKKDDGANNLEREGATGEAVATTRFVEAFTTGDYEKADKAFKDLTESWPVYRKDPVFVYKYAYSLYKENTAPKRQEAAEQLQGLLEQDPDHILAMYLLAEIKAGQKEKQNSKEDAKELLLNAARNGFFTLREIRASKVPEFQALQKDPKFILRAMNASREFNAINIKNGRNPFSLPRIRPDRVEVGPGISPKELANLEGKIDALFQQIESLIKDKEIDKLAPLFIELNAIMTDYKKIGLEKVQLKLKQWEKKLDEWKEVRLAIQLQIYINEGNDYLRAMVKAKQVEKFEDIFENFAQIKGLVEKMRHEEREEFHRNADAILARGKLLNDEAVKLKKIKEFNLVVTGIVVDPRPESKNKAIIVFDDPDKRGRIYEENEDLRDKDDKKVPGLRIVKIQEGSIQFKYEDTPFIRELKAP
jgi:hypothetical protein